MCVYEYLREPMQPHTLYVFCFGLHYDCPLSFCHQVVQDWVLEMGMEHLKNQMITT